MHTERHVRLFKNGRNQALRIPRDFELPGDEAIIRKEDSPDLNPSGAVCLDYDKQASHTRIPLSEKFG